MLIETRNFILSFLLLLFFLSMSVAFSFISKKIYNLISFCIISRPLRTLLKYVTSVKYDYVISILIIEIILFH